MCFQCCVDVLLTTYLYVHCKGVPNRLSKVYEVEVLLCELFVHMSATPPSHSAATDLLTTTAFDYDAGTRCKYHEDNEVPMDYCALGKTKKNW